MSHCSNTVGVEDKTLFVRPDVTSKMSSQARDLLSQQTGQLLIEMGHLFLHTPLNEHIDPKTSDVLISVGKKLKSRK